MAFLLSQKPRKLFLAGFGAGKTLTGSLNCFLKIIESKGKSLGMCISPTFDLVWNCQGKQLMDLDDALYEATGQRIIARVNKQASEIITTYGSKILMRSATRATKNLRGYNLGWAWIDESEACSHPVDLYQLVAGRLRCPRQPNRQLWVTTTPTGMHGCVKLLADLRQQDPKEVCIIRASSLDNPHLDPEFVRSLAATYSKARYRREVLAEILAPAESVFAGEFNTKTHVIPWAEDLQADWGLGCDWGLNYPSFTVWEIHKVEGKNTYICVDEFQPEGMAIERQNLWFQELKEKRSKPPTVVGIDRADTWGQGKMLRRHYGWLTKSMHSSSEQEIMPGIELIRDLLDPMEGQPRLYLSESMVKRDKQNPRSLFWALMNYSWHKTPDGSILDKPYKNGRDDHSIDSSRYFLCKMERKSTLAGFSVGVNYGAAIPIH